MKKIILKLLMLNALILSSEVLASQYTYETNSLVAIEGSYSSFDVENDATPPIRENIAFSGVGLKIGAQTHNYRLFLSAKYSIIDGNYDYAYFYGGELQYLMNFSSFANMYIGVNGGFADFRFVDSLNASRSLSRGYVGGDLGFNIHLSDSIDWEIGGRILSLTDAVSTSPDNSLTYTFDHIVAGYTSIIFKYSMD